MPLALALLRIQGEAQAVMPRLALQKECPLPELHAGSKTNHHLPIVNESSLQAAKGGVGDLEPDMTQQQGPFSGSNPSKSSARTTKANFLVSMGFSVLVGDDGIVLVRGAGSVVYAVTRVSTVLLCRKRPLVLKWLRCDGSLVVPCARTD